MADYYTNSKGKQVDITTMFYPHLANAVAKLEREDPDSDELPAMKALLAEKQEAYEAEQAAKAEAGEE